MPPSRAVFRQCSRYCFLLVACTSASETPRRDSADIAARPNPPAQKCDIRAGTVLTGEGIGALRVGETIADVSQRCRIVGDTVEARAEGLPVRIITVDLGRDTVDAEADSGRVWRIAVQQPAFRTADSLGVGTPLARLLKIPGVTGASGEGAVFALSPLHCGLSFRLSGSGTRPEEPGAAMLRKLPASTYVTEVLIIGVRHCD